MGVGDVGTDEYGNVTRLTAAQQQSYISSALALGASRADVDSFIANNGVNDLGRIVSALGLTGSSGGAFQVAAHPALSPGPGINSTSYSAGIQAGEYYPNPFPAPDMTGAAQKYATPTPISNAGPFVSTPDDNVLTGEVVAPHGNVFGNGDSGGGVPRSTASSAAGFPSWLLIGIAAIAVVALVWKDKS
jgi:hypothetical protein